VAPTIAPKTEANHRGHFQSLAPNLLAVTPPSDFVIATDPSGVEGAGKAGIGVDWLAEAHRAVKAYEIRREESPKNVIAGASRDFWAMQWQHHAGEKFKTDSGDWIVWLDNDCYRIAGWHESDPTVGQALPRVVCRSRPAAAQAP
jgi:hypothetical protein